MNWRSTRPEAQSVYKVGLMFDSLKSNDSFFSESKDILSVRFMLLNPMSWAGNMPHHGPYGCFFIVMIDMGSQNPSEKNIAEKRKMSSNL